MEAQIARTTTDANSGSVLVARAAERLAARIADSNGSGMDDEATRQRLQHMTRAARSLSSLKDEPAVPTLDMKKAALRIAISGGESRKPENREQVWKTLETVRHTAGNRPIEILHASDAGYKTPTEMWADAYRYGRTQYSADWDTHDRLAGVKRNDQVIEKGRPDMVIAFPDGNTKGGTHLTRAADEKSIMTVGKPGEWPETNDVREVTDQAMADVNNRARGLDTQTIQAANRRTSGHTAHVGPIRTEGPPKWPQAREMEKPPPDHDPQQAERELRIIVTGARRHRSEHIVDKALEELTERAGTAPMVIITGGEPGVDSVAIDWAERNGIEIDVYPAEWKIEQNDEPGKQPDARNQANAQAAKAPVDMATDWAERNGVELDPELDVQPIVEQKEPEKELINQPNAGRERNEKMLTEGRPDMVLAFPEGNDRATRGFVRHAESKNIPIEEIRFITRHSPDGKMVNLKALAKTPPDRAPGKQPEMAAPKMETDRGSAERSARPDAATPARRMQRGTIKPQTDLGAKTRISY